MVLSLTNKIFIHSFMHSLITCSSAVFVCCHVQKNSWSATHICLLAKPDSYAEENRMLRLQLCGRPMISRRRMVGVMARPYPSPPRQIQSNSPAVHTIRSIRRPTSIMISRVSRTTDGLIVGQLVRSSGRGGGMQTRSQLQ